MELTTQFSINCYPRGVLCSRRQIQKSGLHCPALTYETQVYKLVSKSCFHWGYDSHIPSQCSFRNTKYYDCSRIKLMRGTCYSRREGKDTGTNFNLTGQNKGSDTESAKGRARHIGDSSPITMSGRPGRLKWVPTRLPSAYGAFHWQVCKQATDVKVGSKRSGSGNETRQRFCCVFGVRRELWSQLLMQE